MPETRLLPLFPIELMCNGIDPPSCDFTLLRGVTIPVTDLEEFDWVATTPLTVPELLRGILGEYLEMTTSSDSVSLVEVVVNPPPPEEEKPLLKRPPLASLFTEGVEPFPTASFAVFLDEKEGGAVS